MKVVQINCSSGGSTGNIARAIHNKLIKENNDSYIFFGVGKSSDKNIQPISSHFIVRLHAFLSRITGFLSYFSYFHTKKLLRKIKKIAPDIIHLHNLHGGYLCLPTLFRFLKSYQGKIVITLHDCWLFTGKCPHFTEVNCNKWKTECKKCPQLSIYPRSLYFDHTKKMYLDKKRWCTGLKNVQIITVSDWLKKTAQQSFLGQYPITRIHNGIDETIFYPRSCIEETKKQYSLENKFVILGVASYWDERKGLKDFCKLSERLQPDDRIFLVGLNQEQIQKLPNNIIGIGAIQSKDELAKIYSMANVFVNMSLEETFGLVTAEAMACGTPVIVFDSTACGEIVAENVGFVVEPGSIQQIIEMISLIKSGKFIADKEGFVYSKNEMVQGYCEVYGL